MALNDSINDFQPVSDSRLLAMAAALSPVLHHQIVKPTRVFRWGANAGNERILLCDLPELALGKGDSLCLDFGTHLVGHVVLDLSSTGSHPDAPAFLRFRFAEIRQELEEEPASFDGWLSRSWFQEEIIHVDELPAHVTPPRRYAFRYLRIDVMDTSPKYKLVLCRAECVSETSADLDTLTPFSTGDILLDKIDQAGLLTLANCMQDVFEDGPKRDRRLWLGDLRLQALTNYASFRNYDLVKRCLYLFGGTRFPDGRVSACLFTRPAPEADDTYLFDYSLLFVVTLEEYLRETDDHETLDDLYSIAMEQIDLSLRFFDKTHIATQAAAKESFVDWCDGLDKTACAQAILIYSLRYALDLAQRKKDNVQIERLNDLLERAIKTARAHFWDASKGVFVSNGQISIASQIWMVLAGVLTDDESRALMEHTDSFFNNYPMVTPYMRHYYISALLETGLGEKALAVMKDYWGGMLDTGTNTFWEVWDPKKPKASPYGGFIANSFCHAWSCTPSYLIRHHFFRNRYRLQHKDL